MMAPFMKDRLTRQELSWLLAQEARGAAKALREGVSLLKQPEIHEAPPSREPPPVETTLDALDEAIGRLSELQSGGRGSARRGRIDLAALLYQVAPSARIAMQPGDGTEVFGEENELRRMLHVLVNQTNSSITDGATSASPEVRIRRDDTWVKISVELGPDVSATAELERRWLSRMATRHGGRLELEGGTQTIVLPAEGAGNEMLELRRELEQAQQLGEAYARELAAVFATRDVPSDEPPVPLNSGPAERLELLKSFAVSLVRPLRASLERARADAALAVETLGEHAPLSVSLQQRASANADLVRELASIADCAIEEPARRLDLVTLAKDAAAAAETRGVRHGIKLELELPPSLELVTRAGVFGLLLRALLDHAVEATPRDGTVTLRIQPRASGVEVITEDGGPSIPEAARADLLRHRVNPSSFGRPGDFSLLVAEAATAHLGGTLSFAENPRKLTVTRAIFQAAIVGA